MITEVALRGPPPLTLSLLVLLAPLACQGKHPGGARGEPDSGCVLDLNGLSRTAWVRWPVEADGERAPDLTSRLRFLRTSGGVRAEYSGGSLSEVYDYACAPDGDGWSCATEAPLEDMCLSLLVAGGTAEGCRAKLATWVPEATVEAIAEASLAAEARADEHRDTETWRRFKLQNNSLGNKQRGRLSVHPRPERCELIVSDTYQTVFDGELVEDSNPVGEDVFRPYEGPALRWRSCTDTERLHPVRLTGDRELPCPEGRTCTADRQREGLRFEMVDSEPTDPACDYVMDVYANARRIGVEARALEVGGALRWTWTLPELTAVEGDLLVVSFERWARCEGGPRPIGVSCAVAALTP